MAAVIPRVIPIFIRELTAASTRTVRDAHIRQFTANLAAVFSSRVLDDDVGDLVACLVSIARAECAEAEAHERAANPSKDENEKDARRSAEESNVLLTVVPDTSSFHILRLLCHMFDLNALHAARCFRALKKLSDNLTRKAAMVAEAEAKSAAVLAAAGINAAGEATNTAGGAIATSSSAIDAAASTRPSGPPFLIAHNMDVALEEPSCLFMDALLQNDSTRRMLVRLWKEWDGSGIDVSHFTASPQKLHLYISQPNSNKMRVYRDFCFCTPRPKLAKQWGSAAACHIKTNIPKKSDIMYRILVEGYNYGVNAVLFSDVVGYTNRNWETITDLEQYGWPKGWDSEMANDYAPGAAVSQYYSADGFLVVKLRAKSMFCVGFGVSAWMVFHGFGAGFPITGTIFHQDEDL